MLAYYSSKGPTFNNKIVKPDITAPGGMIFAASNSYDTSYVLGGSNETDLVSIYTSPINDHLYYYGAVQGTSFASTLVAGITALMLQIIPYLGPEQIREIIQKAAINDRYTTQTPDLSKWGAGKINIPGALKETIRSAGTLVIPKDETAINIYTIARDRNLTLAYNGIDSGYFFVEVLNSQGEIIHEKIWKISKGMNKLKKQISEPKGELYSINITGLKSELVKMVTFE